MKNWTFNITKLIKPGVILMLVVMLNAIFMPQISYAWDGRAVSSLVGKAGGAIGSNAGALVSKGANKIVGAFKGKKSGSSTSGSSSSEGGN